MQRFSEYFWSPVGGICIDRGHACPHPSGLHCSQKVTVYGWGWATGKTGTHHHPYDSQHSLSVAPRGQSPLPKAAFVKWHLRTAEEGTGWQLPLATGGTAVLSQLAICYLLQATRETACHSGQREGPSRCLLGRSYLLAHPETLRTLCPVPLQMLPALLAPVELSADLGLCLTLGTSGTHGSSCPQASSTQGPNPNPKSTEPSSAAAARGASTPPASQSCAGAS